MAKRYAGSSLSLFFQADKCIVTGAVRLFCSSQTVYISRADSSQLCSVHLSCMPVLFRYAGSSLSLLFEADNDFVTVAVRRFCYSQTVYIQLCSIHLSLTPVLFRYARSSLSLLFDADKYIATAAVRLFLLFTDGVCITSTRAHSSQLYSRYLWG